MISILDYGMGNCGSIKSMLRHLGFTANIVSTPHGLETSDAIILPGVGSYDHALRNLAPFRPILEQKVVNEGVPFLGICLGMQLLLERSCEGNLPGFGWIKGEAKRFDFSALQGNDSLVIPHMGWNEVTPVESTSLFSPVYPDEQDIFYFVHSYHATLVPISNQIATATYGYPFTCAIQHRNIFGVQFHPEKSHKYGKNLFKNFLAFI